MITDDNRDLNDHAENDLKRQRSNYNGDQLYSNVSKVDEILFKQRYALISNFSLPSAFNRAANYLPYPITYTGNCN